MKVKNITLFALFLFVILSVAGCGLFHHHGFRRCGTPCAGTVECPCPLQEGSAKANCVKPCCDQVPAAEEPAAK